MDASGAARRVQCEEENKRRAALQFSCGACNLAPAASGMAGRLEATSVLLSAVSELLHTVLPLAVA